MAPSDLQPLPSPGQLWRATAAAILVAAIILIVLVLPAEYRLDPTGIGRRLGLFRPGGGESALAAAVPVATAPETVKREPTPFRTDELMLKLGPGEGAEIKATMRQHDRFVFSWTTDGGEIDFEMHGEPTGAPPDQFTSYWKDEQQASAHGAFDAPFDGNHGWFWENLTFDPVIITLKVSGYYEKIGRLEPAATTKPPTP